MTLPGDSSGPGRLGGRIAATLFLSLVLLFGLLAAWLLGGGLWQAARVYSWERLECTVESSSVEDHPEAAKAGDEFRFLVSYRYSYQGKEYTGNRFGVGAASSADATRARRLADRFAAGARVPCWVDSGQPAQTVLERPNLWLGLIVLVPLLFAGIGAAGLVLVWRGRPARLASAAAAAMSRPPVRRGSAGC
ncbi:MAG: DUF3592 domain-containing protein, partial [Acidobacteriota bacterium]|nr:DUF3592 domain-containing protein [Acidobacteriota bacterium]